MDTRFNQKIHKYGQADKQLTKINFVLSQPWEFVLIWVKIRSNLSKNSLSVIKLRWAGNIQRNYKDWSQQLPWTFPDVNTDHNGNIWETNGYFIAAIK